MSTSLYAHVTNVRFSIVAEQASAATSEEAQASGESLESFQLGSHLGLSRDSDTATHSISHSD